MTFSIGLAYVALTALAAIQSRTW